MCELSVIIPVYNEAENIQPLMKELRASLSTISKTCEIIMVDDGSTDGSTGILQQMAKTQDDVKLIQLKRNFGQTAALMAGFDAAGGEIIVPMDGDLQNDPADIPRLIALLEKGYDVCSGWRKDRKDFLIRRRLLSFFANIIISFLSGVKLHDYGCTLKAYRRSSIKGIQLYGEMHRFIPIYSSWQGARIIEIPVSHRPRIHGSTKYGLDRTIKVILDLIVIVFIGRYMAKPIYFFGGFGLINIFLSFLAFVWALSLKLWMAKSFIETPLPLICVMFMITGILCILMGLLAEIIMRTYFETQGKKAYHVVSEDDSDGDS